MRQHGPAEAGPRLVVGDAAAALRALAPSLSGRVRLVYLDPPYNTGQDFGAYDDRATHGVWLSCMEERLRALAPLLCAQPFVVVHVNVVEQAYLKVLCDELYGRDAMVGQIAWQRAPDRTVLGQGAALLPDHVEYLLCYAPGGVPDGWPRPSRRSPFPAKTLETYARTLIPSAEATEIDRFTDAAGGDVVIFAHASYALARDADAEPSAATFPHRMRTTNQQPESTFQQQLLARMPDPKTLYRAEYAQRRGKHAGPRVRHYLGGNVVLWLRDVAERAPDGTLTRISDVTTSWTADELPATGIGPEGGVDFRRGKKPEKLLARVIEAFSRPGEHVLDAFAGSGTTGAVAERLGRTWTLIEASADTAALAEGRLVREITQTGGAFAVALVR